MYFFFLISLIIHPPTFNVSLELVLIRQDLHDFHLQHLPNISLLQSHHSLIQASLYENESLLSLLYRNPSQSRLLRKTDSAFGILYLCNIICLVFPFTLSILKKFDQNIQYATFSQCSSFWTVIFSFLTSTTILQ